MATPTELQLEMANISRQKWLTRIQLLSALSLLLFITAMVLTCLLPHPTLYELSEQYLTLITPASLLIGIYWGVIAGLLVGQCLHLAVARKDETKTLIVYGVGIRMAGVLVLMGFWALFWTLQMFVVSEIILLTTLALSASISFSLYYYSPTSVRPLDYVFLNVPAKMILCILWNLDIWHNGAIALGWYKLPDEDWNDEKHHVGHSWIVFGIILALAFINSGWVFTYTDIPWAVCSIYLTIAIATKSDGKAPEVYVMLILSAAMVFVALVTSIGWNLIKKDQEGAIRLPTEEENLEAEIAVENGLAVPAPSA